ncbi:CdaR family protein [Butyrivibrio sp. MB2005]|uniref:CdaR family protein n=1 Tax=Butyrivibrio sp. MB2005 TaxID=1280678 RepID=UPI00040CBBDE|nr:CdaR family protein [Butyrivibrio sp. MB2005]
MKKFNLTANWGLKIASLLFAALLWFLVTNINDPVDSVRFSNISVQLRNANSITDENKVYEILEDSDLLSTVTVYAPRSIVDSLNRDNIVAVADLEETKSVDGAYEVQIQLSTNKYSNQIQSIAGSSDKVLLNIENRASKTIAISAATTGSLTDGYIIGDVVTDQNQIRITGAESVVGSVATASVNVEVTGYTTNIGTNAEIHLYDADGEEIPKDNLKLSSTSVGVNVTILATKRVPVIYQVSGVAADGYAATGEVEANPESVLLAGRQSVLNKIEEIIVADTSLDITGLTGDLTATIDLSGYLPGNVSFGDEDFNGIATVVAHIEATLENELEIPFGQVELMNVPEGYQAEIVSDETESFKIKIKGLEATIRGTRASEVTGTIDVSSLTDDAEDQDDLSGEYSATIALSLPGGVTTSDSAEVTVRLTKEE